MPDEFHYDVFLSHGAEDKAVVCPLNKDRYYLRLRFEPEDSE